jgi:hypothetical protein
MNDFRNVFILDTAGDAVSGLYPPPLRVLDSDRFPGIRQNGSITNRNFYEMVAIPFVLDVTFRLVHRVEENRQVVPQDDERLELGSFIIEDLCK